MSANQISDEATPKVTLVCSIEAELTAIVTQVDTKRFALKQENLGGALSSKAKDGKVASSDDSLDDLDDDDDLAGDDDDNDSIFADDAPANKRDHIVYSLEDTEKGNRRVEAGSKVKLQIVDV